MDVYLCLSDCILPCVAFFACVCISLFKYICLVPVGKLDLFAQCRFHADISGCEYTRLHSTQEAFTETYTFCPESKMNLIVKCQNICKYYPAVTIKGTEKVYYSSMVVSLLRKKEK